MSINGCLAVEHNSQHITKIEAQFQAHAPDHYVRCNPPQTHERAWLHCIAEVAVRDFVYRWVSSGTDLNW